MAQEERSREMPHSVILEGREKLTISGVTDVHSFDEEQVLLETVRGMLVVRCLLYTSPSPRDCS